MKVTAARAGMYDHVYIQHKENWADRNILRVAVIRFNTVTAAKLQNNTDKDNNTVL